MIGDWNTLTLVIDNQPVNGLWLLDGEILYWKVDGKEFKIKGSDLSSSVLIFLKSLEKTVFKKSCKLKSCLMCKNFSMSGMARDMGRGQRGVCTFHNRGVEICFLCSDYIEK
jgi:hypothetical protein